MTSQCQKKLFCCHHFTKKSVTENGAEFECFSCRGRSSGSEGKVFRHFLLLVSVIFLLVCCVLSSSEAEEPSEDGDKDEHTHSNTDDDVQGAVVRGGGGGECVARFIDNQSCASSVGYFSCPGVAHTLFVVIEVQNTTTITTVSVALVLWVDDEDSFVSINKSGLSLAHISSSSASARAGDGLAGSYTHVDGKINFESESA